MIVEYEKTMTAKVFHEQVQLMKDTLDRGLMIYQGDKTNRGYRQYKQETMRTFHEFMDGFFSGLVKSGLVEKCQCGATTRRWSDCPLCGGSGYMAVGPATTPEEEVRNENDEDESN